MDDAFKNMLNSMGIDQIGASTDLEANSSSLVFTPVAGGTKDPGGNLKKKQEDEGERVRMKIPIQVTKKENGTFEFDPIIPCLPIKRMTREQIKEFILEYCNSQIYTEMDIPRDMLGMVFMPLVLGALSPPWEIIPEPPVKPTVPEPVTTAAPVKKKFGTKRPAKPSAIEPDPLRVAEIQSNIAYEMASEKDLHQYMAGIEVQDNEQTAAYEVELAQWKADKQAFDAKHKAEIAAAHKKYKRAKAKYDLAMESLEEDLESYEEAQDKWDMEHKAILSHWLKDYGLVYGHIKDATSGRCVNGYPIFFAMHYIHREDMPIVMEGCRRELQRRQEMDKDLDDLLPPEETKAKKPMKSKPDEKAHQKSQKQKKIQEQMDALHNQLMDRPLSKKREKKLMTEMDLLQTEWLSLMVEEN